MALSDCQLHIQAPRPSYTFQASQNFSADSPLPPPRVLTATPPRRARNPTPPPSQLSQSECAECTTTTQVSTIEDFVPPSVVARLRRLDADGLRCLVTNKSVDLDFAYCVPRDLDPSILARLEYSWNLEPQTLNTDTRYNVFPLDRQLHRLFNSNDWFLFPSEDVIRFYLKDRKMPIGTDFPLVPNGLFEYTLIAKTTMEQRTILRAQRGAAASDQAIVHKYPFQTLGVLKSHIHPRFAIWNAGKKLSMGLFHFNQATSRLYADDEHRRLLSYELVLLVSVLYKRWSLHTETLRTVQPPFVINHDALDAPSLSSSQVTKRRRAAPPPRSLHEGQDGSHEPRLTSRLLRAHKESCRDQQMPWTATVWHWIWSCEHALNAFEVDLDTLPDTIDEDDGIRDSSQLDSTDDDASDPVHIQGPRKQFVHFGRYLTPASALEQSFSRLGRMNDTPSPGLLANRKPGSGHDIATMQKTRG
ncbi:hypothetical protein PLICRDRAFT_50173 [Plicaturopsis crispa FD-325 SS-3]|nr:hypothetical protein PLICRDRAFT_50173 [Plicaturopsis crispa FD-325 SS-3]